MVCERQQLRSLFIVIIDLGPHVGALIDAPI
jgi:hypothetical protein